MKYIKVVSSALLGIAFLASSCSKKTPSNKPITGSHEIVAEMSQNPYPGNIEPQTLNEIQKSQGMLSSIITGLFDKLATAAPSKKSLLDDNIGIFRNQLLELQKANRYVPVPLDDMLTLDYLIANPIYLTHDLNIDIYLNLLQNEPLRKRLTAELSDYLIKNPEHLQANFALNNLNYLKSSAFPAAVKKSIKPNSITIKHNDLDLSLKSAVTGNIVDVILLLKNNARKKVYVTISNPKIITPNIVANRRLDDLENKKFILVPANEEKYLNYIFESAKALKTTNLNFSFRLDGAVYSIPIEH